VLLRYFIVMPNTSMFY